MFIEKKLPQTRTQHDKNGDEGKPFNCDGFWGERKVLLSMLHFALRRREGN